MGGDGAVHGTSGPDFGRTDIYRPLIEIAPRKSKTPQKPLTGVYIYIYKDSTPKAQKRGLRAIPGRPPQTFEDPAGSLRFRARDTLPQTVSTLLLSSGSMSCAVMDMRRYGIDRNRPQVDSDTSDKQPANLYMQIELGLLAVAAVIYMYKGLTAHKWGELPGGLLGGGRQTPNKVWEEGGTQERRWAWGTQPPRGSDTLPHTRPDDLAHMGTATPRGMRGDKSIYM